MAADLDEGQLRERLAAREDEVSRFEMQMGELEARFVEVTTQLDATTKARSIAEADAEAQREASASAFNRRWQCTGHRRLLQARPERPPAKADRGGHASMIVIWGLGLIGGAVSFPVSLQAFAPFARQPVLALRRAWVAGDGWRLSHG